ncbi:hypothetical protein H5410_017381, partial [Solanum commersonii]
DPLTLLAGKTQRFRSKPKKFVPPRTICDHCGFKGHFKGDCYRLVGYPPDFQSKRRGPDGFKPNFKPNAHLSKNTDDLINRGKLTENQGSSSQYEDLGNKMDRAGISGYVANMSGMNSLDFKTDTVYEWIIDSGAIHHITPNEDHVYSNEDVVLDTTMVEPSVCGIEPPEVDTVPDVVTAVTKDSDSLYEGNPIPSPDIQPVSIP